jgi:tripartite ATP-independent transporter DctM subunit
MGLVALFVLLVLLGLGVPVALAMGAVAAVGLYLVVGESFLLSTVESLPYALTSDYTFVVIPMFVLMGVIASHAGIIGDLYTAAFRFMSRIRGSLFMATIFAQGAFAAVSGSTVVASSVFTRMALPEMLRFGYNPGVSAGCIAAAGTLAGLIPPSIAMVLYAVLTSQPIGALLIAGIVPGIVTILVYVIGIRIFLRFKPEWAPVTDERYSWRDKLTSLKRVWAIVVLMFVVLGGIYGGVFPPSAAGAVGAAGALIIALSMRRISGGQIWDSLIEAARTTAIIFLIVLGGMLLSRFLIVSGFVNELSALVVAADLSVYGFLLITVVLFVLLGMFIDSVSLLVITVPFLFPISQSLDIHPIWFGVIVVKLIEVAAITPPVGLNLYAVLASADGKLTSKEMFRGVSPFILMDVVVLAILIGFPELVTWLPSTL